MVPRRRSRQYIHILKDAGITVFHAVPSLAGAMKAVNAGVDGLVVEGTEGGGQSIRRSWLTAFNTTIKKKQTFRKLQLVELMGLE